jgi:hypothetical protein
MPKSRKSILHDPKYWELRAEETRVILEHMTDPEARGIVLSLSESYAAMAKRAAALATAANKTKTGERVETKFPGLRSGVLRSPPQPDNHSGASPIRLDIRL